MRIKGIPTVNLEEGILGAILKKLQSNHEKVGSLKRFLGLIIGGSFI